MLRLTNMTAREIVVDVMRNTKVKSMRDIKEGTYKVGVGRIEHPLGVLVAITPTETGLQIEHIAYVVTPEW